MCKKTMAFFFARSSDGVVLLALMNVQSTKVVSVRAWRARKGNEKHEISVHTLCTPHIRLWAARNGKPLAVFKGLLRLPSGTHDSNSLPPSLHTNRPCFCQTETHKYMRRVYVRWQRVHRIASLPCDAAAERSDDDDDDFFWLLSRHSGFERGEIAMMVSKCMLLPHRRQCGNSISYTCASSLCSHFALATDYSM